MKTPITCWQFCYMLHGQIYTVSSDTFTERQRDAICHIIGAAGKDPAPPTRTSDDVMEQNRQRAHEVVAQGREKRDAARSQGYVGEACQNTSCGSFRTRRNGSCLVCEDCGQTTGCS